MRILSAFLILIITSCKTNVEHDNLTRQIVSGDNIVAFIFEESGKQGLIDTNNNIILQAQFDYIQDWQDNGLIVVDSGGKMINGGDYLYYQFGKYGIIDTKGNILFRPQFDEVSISDNSVLVKKDSLFGFIDRQGNWLIKPRYKYATQFNKGVTIVKVKDKFYIINKNDSLISKNAFDTIWGFKNNISVVKRNENWGLINVQGKFIIPLENYTGIGDFNWNHGKVQKNKKWFVVDTSGNIFKQPFDEVTIKNNNDTIFAEGVNNNKKIIIRLK